MSDLCNQPAMLFANVLVYLISNEFVYSYK
jgi:hypothetical protein